MEVSVRIPPGPSASTVVLSTTSTLVELEKFLIIFAGSSPNKIFSAFDTYRSCMINTIPSNTIFFKLSKSMKN
jgi:ssDNA-specific exonuclease RecJ